MDITMRIRPSHRMSPCHRRRKLQVRPWQMLSGQATEPDTVPASENAPAP